MPRGKTIMLDLTSEIDDASQPWTGPNCRRTIKPPLTQAWSERLQQFVCEKCAEATAF
jgi:hypothetical protein